MKRPRERKNEGRGFSPRPSSQLVKKVPYGAFLTALPRRAFWPNTKCFFRKALFFKAFRAAGYWIREQRFAAAGGRYRQIFKAFRAAGYWIREQRFAAAGGRYRQSAVSAAAPLAGRHEVGPGMALRQGEQGALPPRAPLLLCPLTFQRGFLTVSERPSRKQRDGRSRVSVLKRKTQLAMRWWAVGLVRSKARKV